MKPAPAVPVSTIPFFLTFRDPICERRYVADHAAKLRTHDLQAAAIYLAMVASGSLLYLIISAAGIKATTVDCCMSLIICSWLGPAAHLALLWLLPTATYEKHRTMITIGFRAFYLLATSINGFGVCGVGPIGSPSLLVKPTVAESPMSAFVWRSGIIGLIWYAGAFPLLFWQHAFVQTGFLVAYWRMLSPVVCSAVQTVQYGPETMSGVVRGGLVLWAQLLAATGAPQSATQMLERAVAAAGCAVVGNSSFTTCMRGLGLLQVVAGHALPSFVIYCTEACSRQRWLAAQRQRQQVLLHRTSSSASSGSASSTGSQLRESSSCSNLQGSVNMCGSALLAAPATSAATAAGSLWASPAGPAVEEIPAAAASQQGREGASLQETAACSTFQQTSGASCSSSSRDALSSTSEVPYSRLGAASAVAGVKAAAVKAGKQLVKQTASWRRSSSSVSGLDGSGDQELLLDLPQLDAFEIESTAGHLPPNFPEVYVLLLFIGLAWLGLQSAV